MDFRPAQIRKHVLEMAFRGQTVHVPCAFSIAEILSVLYTDILRFNRNDPKDPSRDYFILSKGHGVMALYACLAEIGWITPEELLRYCQDNSKLHGLAEDTVPGIETNGGSLGHGLPVAAGIALGLKLRKKFDQRVYCLVGDGELNEGSNWEAMLFANHWKLDNLTVIVDANGLQAMGKCEDILSLEPMPAKFASFGFEAAECDGHSVTALRETLQALRKSKKPQALVARTQKGGGVSFMAGQNHWHYTRLTQESYEKCLAEIDPKGSGKNA